MPDALKINHSKKKLKPEIDDSHTQAMINFFSKFLSPSMAAPTFSISPLLPKLSKNKNKADYKYNKDKYDFDYEIMDGMYEHTKTINKSQRDAN